MTAVDIRYRTVHGSSLTHALSRDLAADAEARMLGGWAPTGSSHQAVLRSTPRTPGANGHTAQGALPGSPGSCCRPRRGLSDEAS